MKKYFVTVDEGKTVRFYKDEACEIPHRDDGPAVEYSDGYKAYYQNDKLHRTDGPAVEHANGGKQYWQNGKCHRDDGPAVEFASGYKEYYLNGKKLTKAEFLARNVPSCEGKMVEIDGKKYKLTAI